MSGVITVNEMTFVGGLAFIFIFLAFWISQTNIRRDDIPGFKQAGLALQLSGKAAIVQKVVGDENSKDRSLLRSSIRKDFVFIFGYAGFFVALGLLLSQVRTNGALWLGLASAVAMLAAAGCDFVENYRALHILSLPTTTIDDAVASKLRRASLLKWFFFFLTIGLQSVILIKLMNWYSLIGFGLLISAIAGIAGLFFHALIPLALISMGLPVIAIAVVLVLRPAKFMQFFS